MKKTSSILVYDSGIGGLTTLAAITKLLPNENFIYYADQKNCPYGSKCKTELQEIVYKNLKQLTKRSTISHIVLACNTATTATIEYLRTKFDIPIIGTEPNVREPAKLKFEHITLIATPVTVNEEKLLNLENSLSTPIKNIGIKNLAKYIEDYYVTGNKSKLEKAQFLINQKLSFLPQNSAIVLGCTHYVYMKKYVESLGFKCFDGNQGVAKRLNHLINQDNNPQIDKQNKSRIIFITGNMKNNLIFRKIYKNYLKSQ